MYIVSMKGEVLASFDKWNIKSVEIAEAWIKHHRYYIYSLVTIHGETYITVRHY